MSVHVEVAGDAGEGEAGPLQRRRQQELAAQARVLLQQRRLVQQILLPGGAQANWGGGKGWGRGGEGGESP